MTTKMPTNQTQLQTIYQELKSTLEIEEAEIEARLILQNILELSQSELISKSDQILSKNQISRIYSIRDQRKQTRTPLAYLLEEAWFAGRSFFVNKDVLIPRPETELLIQQTLAEIKIRDTHQPRILDLGTGSGCIAITLKHALPAATIYASDISKASLSVAAINAKRHEVDIQFVMGDYLEPFLGTSSSPVALPVMKGKPPYFDVVVSNPPYISEEDYAKLEPELHHEPKHALTGFPYKQIKEQVLANNLLEEGGFMAFEFGQGQRPQLEEIFPQAKFYQDLEKNDRILVWKNEPNLVMGFKPMD